MIRLSLAVLVFLLAPVAMAIPTFPGAQGGGAISVGGRGGTVIEVNTLSNSGAGSLRACTDALVPRTCVFRIGGTIQLTNELIIRNPFITIAGQTAPGGGILLSGKFSSQSMIRILAANTVMRYIRVRKGWTAACGDGATSDCGANVIVGGGGKSPVMVDHVSASWNQDEGIASDAQTVNGITFSYNISAPELKDHPTSAYIGSDSPAQSLNVDFHHNLFMNGSHRVPLAKGGSGRHINNLYYNHQRYYTQIGGGGSVDVVANKFRRGPQAPSLAAHEIQAYFNSSGTSNFGMPGAPSIFLSGNIGWHQTNAAGDQWLMGARIDTENAGENGTPIPTGWRRGAPLPNTTHPIIVEPVANIEASILPTVGASRRLDCSGNWVMNRDAVDTRLISQYTNNTGISVRPLTEDGLGGFPSIANGTPCPDDDHDGMPNVWETSRGLNPNNAADRNGVQPTGYTNLEVYLAGAGGTEPPDPPLPQPPSVDITGPPNGARVVGAITVTADASDDAAVLGVQFKLDGANLGAEDTSSPYSVPWNSATASEGSHTLTAVARDAVPNSTTSSPVTVNVDNVAAVAKFNISDRVVVNNALITVRTTPTEGGSPGTSLGNQNVGVQGTVLAGPITASNAATYWQINYDTGLDGWSAEQFLDEVGTPANAPPTASLTAPANGATVSGPVTVSATASDPGGAVLGVQFKLDGGNLLLEDTSSPYSIIWNSALSTDGPHQLGAVARDSLGATGSAAARTVTVNNADICP